MLLGEAKREAPVRAEPHPTKYLPNRPRARLSVSSRKCDGQGRARSNSREDLQGECCCARPRGNPRFGRSLTLPITFPIVLVLVLVIVLVFPPQSVTDDEDEDDDEED
jgi:hypothetical protein